MSDCFEKVNQAEGSPLSATELAALEEAIDAHARYVALRDGLSEHDARLKAGQEVADRIEMAAFIEKRNAAMNAAKRLERVGWVQQHFGNNVALGIESMLVGTQRAKQGARLSVASVQESLKAQYLAGFTHDLESSGHGALFASGAMDREVARALYDLRREGADLSAHSTEAVELARIVAKWQEVTRLDANRAGAWIGQRDDYITRQSHVPEKVRGDGGDAGFEAWAEVARRSFDLPQMMALSGAADPEKVLKALWTNLASGNHLKAAPEDVASGFKGPANVAKKLSQGRSVIFKDADSWFDYNQQFGSGNLRESVLQGLERSAQSTGIMQMLGTNPAAMVNAIRDDLTLAAKEAGNVEAVTKLADEQGKHERYLSAVDGSMNIAGNAMWARRAANVRSWQSLSKLGGMLLSQLNDVAVYGSGARYQGRGFFSGMAEAVGGLGRSLEAPERRELAASLGVVLDNMAGELGRVGSFNEAGSMSRVMGTFMKWNGSNWWQSRMRTSAAFGMSHHMALQAGKTFAEIGGEYQRVLGLYGIGEAEWNVIRQTAEKHVDGKAYIVPEAVRSLTDEQMAGYTGSHVGKTPPPAAGHTRWYHGGSPEGVTGPLWFTADLRDAQGWASRGQGMKVWYVDVPNGEKGIDWGDVANGVLMPTRQELPAGVASHRQELDASLTPEELRRNEKARREIEDKLRTYYVDQTSTLALEPDQKTRAIVLQGTRPGTWTGEFMRFAMQFKSFTGAYMQRILGRELYGRGYEGDSLIGALRNSNGELQGLARLVAMTTILGYASMSLKDLAKGKTPRDPTEDGQALKVMLAAMVQGGGAGIYGDFLFGAANRMGSGTVESLVGPVISSAGRIVDLYHKALEGDDVSARAFGEVLNNTPFMNLFYVRPVLNYMVLYQIQDMLSPGYMRRMTRDAEKQGQEWLIRPG